MSLSRRMMMKATALGMAGAACGGKLYALDSYFIYPNAAYPIIEAGSAITYSERVTSLTTFRPTFGADRPIVNAVEPKVNGRTIQFDQPGEYYLIVNARDPIKVLVLERNLKPSAAMLPFFDFLVANTVWGGLHDQLWYNQRPSMVKTWLESTQPLVITCGPTHQLVRDIVRDRFQLPTRIYTIPGVFYGASRGDVVRSTHNIAEIYLPDIGKWVPFDVNNAFVPKWSSALDVADAVAAVWGPQETSGEKVSDVGLDLHTPMDTGLLNDKAFAEMPEEERGRFQKSLIIPSSVTIGRAQALRIYRSGVAYWGGRSMFGSVGNTAFLPFDYTWASLACDENLRDNVYEWMESFGHHVNVILPYHLRRLFESGHAAELRRQAWKTRFPDAS